MGRLLCIAPVAGESVITNNCSFPIELTVVGSAASQSHRPGAPGYGRPSATYSAGWSLPPTATTMYCLPSCM